MPTYDLTIQKELACRCREWEEMLKDELFVGEDTDTGLGR